LFVCLASAMVATGQHVYVWVLLMTLAIRVAQPFYRAAMFAIGPSAVPTEALGRFNGYSNICLQGGQLLGAALIGPVLVLYGSAVAFLLNGLTFLFSALAVGVISVQRTEAAPSAAAGQAFWRQLLTGWGEIGALLRREAGFALHIGLCALDAISIHMF